MGFFDYLEKFESTEKQNKKEVVKEEPKVEKIKEDEEVVNPESVMEHAMLILNGLPESEPKPKRKVNVTEKMGDVAGAASKILDGLL